MSSNQSMYNQVTLMTRLTKNTDVLNKREIFLKRIIFENEIFSMLNLDYVEKKIDDSYKEKTRQ